MHTVFALQVSIGVLALDFQRAGLDAGIIAFEQVAHHTSVSVGFRPAHIHTHQHLSPVLRFGSTRAGVDLQYGVHGILLTAEHILQFQILQCGQSPCIEFIHLCFGNQFFAEKLVCGFQFTGQRLYRRIALNPFFQAFYQFHLCLRTFGIFPETGILRTQLFFFVLHLLAIYVQIAVK